MPLTPEDVHNKQFTTVRLREGYDEEEVDAFLDEVEAELTRLIRENEELRAKLAAATRAAASAAAAPVPIRREYRQRLKSYLDGQMRQLESQGDDAMASSRPQLSSAGMAPPPPPQMPQQHQLPPGMSPMAPQQPMVPQLGNTGMNNGMGSSGLNATGGFQQQNNSASALTQTMAP